MKPHFQCPVKQLYSELSGVTLKAKAIMSEKLQITELDKKIKRLELEKKTLKKTTDLLMSDEYQNMC